TLYPISIKYDFSSLRNPKQRPKIDGCSYTTAGPTLIMNGEILKTFHDSIRHPRSAVGIKDSNTLLFLVVDGRQEELSAGMTLRELAAFLKTLGVREAYNLDGGGSSTLVVKGRVMNSPSDTTGERPVGDAIILFPR
ncbi:MAG TPA: phosphodiester glycosidase family protein, partial [Bdellovibrionota bacterium]|nr:phosphodiester glycosidase family protein [Bdellovibrionota bacterium]